MSGQPALLLLAGAVRRQREARQPVHAGGHRDRRPARAELLEDLQVHLVRLAAAALLLGVGQPEQPRLAERAEQPVGQRLGGLAGRGPRGELLVADVPDQREELGRLGRGQQAVDGHGDLRERVRTRRRYVAGRLPAAVRRAARRRLPASRAGHGGGTRPLEEPPWPTSTSTCSSSASTRPSARSFAEIEQLTEPDELRERWRELSDQLEVHASAEEAVFYPELLQEVDDTEGDTSTPSTTTTRSATPAGPSTPRRPAATRGGRRSGRRARSRQTTSTRRSATSCRRSARAWRRTSATSWAWRGWRSTRSTTARRACPARTRTPRRTSPSTRPAERRPAGQPLGCRRERPRRPRVPRPPAGRGRRRRAAGGARRRAPRTPTSGSSGCAASTLALRDARLERLGDDVSAGLAVRVVHDGAWGFASGAGRHARRGRPPGRARRSAMARTARPLNAEPVELADEPVHAGVTWVSAYDVDPFTVPTADKVALLEDWSRRLLGARRGAARRRAPAAGAGGQVLRRHRGHLDDRSSGCACSRRSPPPGSTRRAASRRCAPSRRRSAGAGSTSPAPAGTGTASSRSCPGCWPRRSPARSVEPGRYDLVVDPTNLWLTIHESIGHATELDRALGYEAAYAGTSFATLDQLGTLRYGSDVMHVTGDRTVPHGLSTVGYDDEGVQTQQWDIVRGGTLVGYQLDRRMARQNAAVARRLPLQRLRVRRLPAARADPADGQRLAAAGGGRPVDRAAHRRRGAGDLRGRRQELVDRHAALQLPVHRPAVLRDPGRPARRPAPRRRLPGDDDGLLGLDGGRRRPADVRARRRLQLRQGPARARSRRSRTAARRRCSAAWTSSTPPRRPAGE